MFRPSRSLFLLALCASVLAEQTLESSAGQDCDLALGNCAHGDSAKRELIDVFGAATGGILSGGLNPLNKLSNFRSSKSTAGSSTAPNGLMAPLEALASAGSSLPASLGLPPLELQLPAELDPLAPLSLFKPQPDVDAALYPVAQENFKRWNDALKSKDYDRVASLYSTTDVSFLPTVSAEFIRDAPKTREYFMEFLKKHPVGTITSDKVQSFGKDAYLHTGLYTFEVGPDGNRTSVDARFSYMWRKLSGAWKIVHHHSSALPGAKAEASQQSRNEAMYPVAQANFKVWNDALQTKDYKLVASLYSTTDVSFLPTVSADFIRDSPSTEAYFMEFLKKLPYGTITADKVQSFCDNSYLHSGMYTFMVGPADNRTPVQARFSYMWARIDKLWKIVHHHSSVLPPK